ncbi:MAG TPA: rod shape-determining protein MreD [Solirubrobacteraceae bacterium]|jgi:rod shape-determining protein MreD
MSQPSPQANLGLRITLLAVVVVFVQIGAISEVPIFGVNVEIAPLLAAFVGLICGSVPGAVAGFGIGLLIDLTLAQTLGITSLLFTLIGFWAGRLHELRDPQGALVPVAIGAVAATIALLGYSIIEFLLGVDAPVSFELLRQIVLGVLVDAIVALPFWLIVKRVLEGGLPQDPRRRRRSRRAYSTGGLSPLSRS